MRALPAGIGLLSLLVACHSEPFDQDGFGTKVPFDPGPPPRLTVNTGPDEEISFTPDGADLMYTFNQRCFAFVPAHQARAREWRCAPEEEGIADRYRFGSISNDGSRIAFQFSRQREIESGPFYQAVLLARFEDFRDSTEVTPVPFVSVVDGVLHRFIQGVAVLRGDTVAILADDIVYLTDPWNKTHPREFVRLPLPGQAASIQAGRAGTLLYLRLRGDSRVLAWDLETRSLSVIHDFGTTPFGAVTVGPSYLAAGIPGAVLRVNRRNGRVDTIPAFALTINELAMTPDGRDIIAAGLDTIPGQFATDLYRLNP